MTTVPPENQESSPSIDALVNILEQLTEEVVLQRDLISTLQEQLVNQEQNFRTEVQRVMEETTETITNTGNELTETLSLQHQESLKRSLEEQHHAFRLSTNIIIGLASFLFGSLIIAFWNGVIPILIENNVKAKMVEYNAEKSRPLVQTIPLDH
jgi:hypothetical protein